MCHNRLSCTITDNTALGNQIRLTNTNVWQGKISAPFIQPYDISSDPENPSVDLKIFQYCGSHSNEPGITGIITYAIDEHYNLVFSFNIPKFQNLLEGGNSCPFFYASIVPVNAGDGNPPAICIEGIYIVQNAKDPNNPGGQDDLLFDADSGISIYSLDAFITLGVISEDTVILPGPGLNISALNNGIPFPPQAAVTIRIRNETEGFIVFNSLDFLESSDHSKFAPSGMPPVVMPTVTPALDNSDWSQIFIVNYGVMTQYNPAYGSEVYCPYSGTKGVATFNMPNGTLLTITWNMYPTVNESDLVPPPTIEADPFYAIEGRDTPSRNAFKVAPLLQVGWFTEYNFELVISRNGEYSN
jgi:hypothetical protein